ncbi:uncharacterized protein DUF1700 [Chitinophaga skermanii]|uniref:Uncharacterized protein DUF1700 n=1 Tax=Chitinophaga skermanii TaxID=331697 RepID=A0A327QWJ2_9BACT|nr:DUF1700 domain-containing protein [Chitinophaga skermanii]RAJ08315.1 uncharacterized protein DUF1700 [Chitinophaga skermanii]
MKIATIPFEQAASARVYSDYMKRVKREIQSLPQQSQDDIYMEFNSHIFEAIQHRGSTHEIDALLDILEKLGEPHDVLKQLVADKKLEQATRTFNPLHIFKALVLNITNGFSYIIFAVLYLFLFAFLFLIVAKIMHPEQVGLFTQDGHLKLLGRTTNPLQPGMVEILGDWFISLMLFSAVLFYFIITLLLRIKKSINKK